MKKAKSIFCDYYWTRLGSSPVAVTSPSDFAPASSKEFLDIQAECGFTLKRVRDMTRTYSHKIDCYIFHIVLLVITLLLIITIICYHYAKRRLKQ